MEQTQNVSIDDIQSVSETVYTDGDIAFIDDICDIDKYGKGSSVSMDMIMFLFCTEGKASFCINSKPFTLRKQEMLLHGPQASYQDLMISPDFKAKILCISTRIINSLVRLDKNIINRYFSVKRNPVLPVDDEGLQLVEYYYELLKFRVSLPKRPYHKEAMAGLVSAALYDMLGALDEPQERIGTDKEQITQGDLLFHRFIELISTTSPKPRSVSWYARELCITPKYLSTVVRQTTGKTALKWITDAVVEDIRRLLTHSSASIKEITDTLDFPNISFFGKYTKHHLGCSPTEFRRKMSKDSES